MVLATTSLLFIGDDPMFYRDLSTFEGNLSPLFCVVLIQNFIFAHLNFDVIVLHISSRIFNPFKDRVVLFTFLYVAVV